MESALVSNMMPFNSGTVIRSSFWGLDEFRQLGVFHVVQKGEARLYTLGSIFLVSLLYGLSSLSQKEGLPDGQALKRRRRKLPSLDAEVMKIHYMVV